MREVLFIKQNKEKWLSIEDNLINNKNLNADKLVKAYFQLLDDLSYAQSYYPDSNTTLFLNSLTAQIYRKIYKTKLADKNRFVSFFKEDVPKVAFKHKKLIYFSFAIFLFYVFLGFISAHYNSNFVNLILGNSYVEQTLKNIKYGNPMAVYNNGRELGSSIAITLHNVQVAFMEFISGILGGIFTLYIAMKNAFMIGAFQYLFYREGVLFESLKTIWLHGATEVFSIIISSTSGFILAKSLFIPKTYSRLDSLKIGFQESLKLFLSTIPFFIIAGFIEGFITRHATKMPFILNLTIILGSLFFISYYFLIYPFKTHKNESF